MLATAITTPRLRLEPFDCRHFSDEYVSWLNNKALMQYSENQFLTHDRNSCLKYASSFDHKQSFLWAVVQSSDQRHVGNINAYYVARHRLADIGILIGAANLKGQGLGLEAWNGVLQFLFRHLDCRKVTGGCASKNEAMIRIMERANMVDDGARKNHLSYGGEEMDILYRALFSSHFRVDPNIALIPSALPDWNGEN